MRKVLFMLISLLFLTDVFGQNHLKFLDIPIDGTIESFGSSLSKKDYYKSSLSDKSYTGHFYQVIASVELHEDEINKKVNSVKVRYNQSMTSYNRNQMINLYLSITKGLKTKYKSAKITDTGDDIIFSLPQGYIYCRFFSTIFEAMGGGINVELTYVDKTNTSNFKLPVLKSPDSDL